MVKIFIAIVLSICAFITPLKLEKVSANTENMPIVSSIKTVQGNGPTGNVFVSLSSFLLFNVSGGWSHIYNYYSNNSLEYTFEGVQPINVSTSAYLPQGNNVYAIELNFRDYVLLNNYRQFSVVFGVFGSLINITGVDVGLNNQSNNSTNFYYEGLVNDEYLLTFGYDGYNQIKFIRIYFTADLLSNFYIDSSEFLKFFMYGMYTERGGYPQGYDDGYNVGYDEGYNAGYNGASSVIDINSASYNAGYNKGVEESSNLFELFSSAVSAPVNVLMDTFNFELMGVNVATFILSLLTLCFIVIVLRLLL